MEHRLHTGHRRQVGTPGVGRDGEVGGTCETVLHTAPGDIAPLLNGADGEAVAAAVEVKLREGTGDRDRVGAGCGVEMHGIAILVEVAVSVSPVHRVIVGEVAVGRDGDGLVGLDGPSGHERERFQRTIRGAPFVCNRPAILFFSGALWRERRSIGCCQRRNPHSPATRSRRPRPYSSRSAGSHNWRLTVWHR